VTHPFPGGLGAAQFLQRHWQREPLLVRGAFPGFVDPLSPREVLALAGSPDAASRLVSHKGDRWTLEQGPILPGKFKRLPRRDWTVLVQDTNHFSDRANALLARFDFISHARIDDLMVSYAMPGGGVGPHVDSYDVFLVQGHGRRRWQISRQADHAFRADAPLRILEDFRAEEEWVLEAGDMLYLPPGVAHHGVAETECLTWSVGFRAPSDRELVSAFLDFLHERLEPAGHYADPGTPPARHPGEVPAPLLQHTAKALGAIRWSEADVREFSGRYLSEPKQHVVFDPPRRPHSRARFEALANTRGLALDRRTRLLFSGTMFFVNGEVFTAPPGSKALLQRWADKRELPAPVKAAASFWDLAFTWYTQGFVHFAGGRQT
jgi:50S ribosomal protein L16 3-hydroxylase